MIVRWHSLLTFSPRVFWDGSDAARFSRLIDIPPHPSIPLPRRLRTGTPTHTPVIPAPGPQPLLRAEFQLPFQFRTGFLAVDEIAKAAPDAALTTVEPTASFPEIGHGGQLAVDRAGRVPAGVEGVAGLLGGILVFEAGVDVPDQIFSPSTHTQTTVSKKPPIIRAINQ